MRRYLGQTLLFILIVSISYGDFALAEKSNASHEYITPYEIERFGWEHVGKDVDMIVELVDVYAAKRTGNRGRIAAVVKSYSTTYSNVAMFKEGMKSKDIIPFIGKCVWLKGKISLAELQIQGAISETPHFEIQTIDKFDVCF